MTGTATQKSSLRRVLLTGGTGFVGKWLSPAIAECLPSAELYQLRRSQDNVELIGWTSIIADLESGDEVEKAIAMVRPDLVVHLGAQSSVSSAFGSEALTWDINFGGSLRLANACAIHSPSVAFLLVSTSEVYGKSFLDGPATEATHSQPLNTYARSKLAAEMALFDILPDAACLIAARPFNHTGPGQDQRFSLPAFAAQIAAIEAGRQPPVLHVGNLDTIRDFLDVRDVVAAYVAIIGNLDAFARRDVVNISSGRPWRIAELLDKFRGRALCDFEIRVDKDRLRPSDIPRAEGVSEKLQRLTGWTARVPMEETLDALLEYWRQAIANEPASTASVTEE